MGNICLWCCKNSDDSQSHNFDNESANANSTTSLISPNATERTPLIKSSSHTPYNQPSGLSSFNVESSLEPSSFIPNIVPPPLPPPLIHDNSAETQSTKLPSNEVADSSMATIVERMLPDLIDVGGWGGGTHQTNLNSQNSNEHNDNIKQALCRSLQSSRVSLLPDAGTSNLSSLLSGRPISSTLCHYVAHTANELSRLLIEEIKIVHKEELVVTFE